MTEDERNAEKVKSLFKDSSGQNFDPKKKFGTIEADKALIYDNVTTSYPVNLPSDYYQKHV
jgi:hypothetical protein